MTAPSICARREIRTRRGVPGVPGGPFDPPPGYPSVCAVDSVTSGQAIRPSVFGHGELARG